MRSVISKGKDIKEAIEKGLKALGANRREVDIEVVQEASKGFYGIGAKPAIVKLVKKESGAADEKDEREAISEMNGASGSEEAGPSKLEREERTAASGQADRLPDGTDAAEPAAYVHYRNAMSRHPEAPEQPDGARIVVTPGRKDVADANDLDGKAWVKNGKLYFKSSPDHQPSVTLGDHVILLKNDRPVCERTVQLSDKDRYELKTRGEEKETIWKLELDRTKLRAILHVEPGVVITRTLPDAEPAGHLDLLTEEKRETVNHLTHEQIIDKLKELQVKRGIHHDEIMKAVATKEPGTFEVATGEEPVSGRNGRLELMVDIAAKTGLHVDKNGRINFRERLTIPTVDRGQVIAAVHPPVPGKPGLTVTNEPLPPDPTYPLEVKLGAGVTQRDDKIVAMTSGSPKVKQRGRYVHISIVPKLVHSGDVDLASGNIRFKGDVEIHGGVKEGMIVEASGDILVHSTVSFAKMTASGAIITKGNVISSELTAGKHMMLLTELEPLLGTIHEQTEKLIAAIKQLVRASALKKSDFSSRGLPSSIKILLEKKFQSLVPAVKQLLEVIKKNEKDLEQEAWKEVAALLNQVFLATSGPAVDFQKLENLTTRLKDLKEWSAVTAEPEAHITVSSAQNSKLFSSGNITVVSTKGCINSKIHAGGHLKINGIARGGELYGQSGVDIHTVGSEIGIATLIAVPNGQSIKIKKAMEGTVLKIGNAKKTIKETVYNIHAHLNKNEQIVLDTF